MNMDTDMNIGISQIGSTFKPRRTLYYMEPTAKEKEDFYTGIIPEKLRDS